jgi:hypothetical protein
MGSPAAICDDRAHAVKSDESRSKDPFEWRTTLDAAKAQEPTDQRDRWEELTAEEQEELAWLRRIG